MTQEIKLTNNCTLNVSFLDRFGRLVEHKSIKSASCVVSLKGTTTTYTPTVTLDTVDNEATVSLTYASHLKAAGLYAVKFILEMADGSVLTAEETLVEVVTDSTSSATSYTTTVVFNAVYDRTYVNHEKTLADGGTLALEDGDVVTGTAIDSATITYDVDADINARATIAFKAGGTTHAITLPTGYKKIVTPSTAVSKTYLFVWSHGVLVTCSEQS